MQEVSRNSQGKQINISVFTKMIIKD